MRITLTLGAKIFAILIVVTVIVLISSVITIGGSTSLEKHINKLASSIVRLNAQTSVRIALLEETWALARWQNPWLPLERYDAEFERMDKAMTMANDAFKIYEGFDKASEEQLVYNKFKESIMSIMDMDTKLYTIAKEYRGDSDAAKTLSDKVTALNYYKEMDIALALIDEMHSYADKRCNEDIDESIAEAESEIRFSIIVGVVLVGICAAVYCLYGGRRFA